MTAEIVAREPSIRRMSEASIAAVRELENITLSVPQVDIATHHTLHAGLYSRTICIPAGVVLTGAFITIPTLLIFNGRARVAVDNEWTDIAGYRVLPASAGRKQAFIAESDTHLTMVFPTEAKTVEQAEEEFTNEAHLLFSRAPDAQNFVTITGE